MTEVELKQKLHYFIDFANSKKLQELYDMVKDQIPEGYNYWDDESFIQDLSEREENYLNGSDSGFTLRESVLRAKEALNNTKK